MKEMEMKKMGIKEIARQVKEIADKKLMGRKGCATFTDNEIVLCVKDKPEYLTTGVTFDADTPRLILMATRNIINRLVFDLSPEETSSIVASARPVATIHPRKNLRLAYSA